MSVDYNMALAGLKKQRAAKGKRKSAGGTVADFISHEREITEDRRRREAAGLAPRQKYGQGGGRGQRNTQTGTGVGQRTTRTGSGVGLRVKKHPPGKPYQWANGSYHTRPQGREFRSNYRKRYGTPASGRSAPKASPIKYF